MSGGPLLIPNVAAEEGAVWRKAGGETAARRVAGLWRLLFGPDTELLANREPEAWPEALGPRQPAPIFDWLDAGDDAAFAWWNDATAERLAREQGRRLWGAAPEVATRVHDKGFALDVARRERLLPPALRDAIALYDADELRDPDAVVRRIDAKLADWPPWMARNFTLKPRLGSSGRGRVPGRSESADTDEVRGALGRLAERGGAVLEPWLERRADLSAQLYVDASRGVVLMGALEQLTTPSGVYRGHRGTIDHRGRIHSALPDEEPVREAAALVAVAAREAGYVGPCSVDAFRYSGADGDELRPVVELNARFTMGTLVVGLLRRALPRIREAFPGDSSSRRPFHFALTPPEGGWPAADADTLVFRLDAEAALVVERGPAQS
ncbi:MAG: hypothetical protein QNK03_25680 [Myxococcota bacterium]|nr:hypothetical protein [Myxococcota bacterium]